MSKEKKEYAVYDAASRTILEVNLPSEDAARDRFAVWYRDQGLSDDAPVRSLHVVELPAFEPPVPTGPTEEDYRRQAAIEAQERVDARAREDALLAADRKAIKNAP